MALDAAEHVAGASIRNRNERVVRLGLVGDESQAGMPTSKNVQLQLQRQPPSGSFFVRH